jgi:hypothetical protein
MEKVASEIQKGTELKKTETRDASAPVIDPDTKVKTVDRAALVSGVTNPPELKKTETRDSSAPKTEGATVNMVDRVAQQQTVKQGAVARAIGNNPELKNTSVEHDASAPVIDPDTKLKTVDRAALVSGVTNPPELKKTETKDSSAPKTEGASVNMVDRVAQQQVIRQGAVARSIESGNTELKSTGVQHDASAPVIDPDVKVKKVDRAALVSGVTNPPELKKTETKDSSAPVIPPDAGLRECDRVKMCIGIETAGMKK